MKNDYLDEDVPWLGILAATYFAELSMYHTTLQAMSCQLFFGRDMILNIPLIEEWEYIRLRKQNNHGQKKPTYK